MKTANEKQSGLSSDDPKRKSNIPPVWSFNLQSPQSLLRVGLKRRKGIFIGKWLRAHFIGGKQIDSPYKLFY